MGCFEKNAHDPDPFFTFFDSSAQKTLCAPSNLWKSSKISNAREKYALKNWNLHKPTEIYLIQIAGSKIQGKNPQKCGDMHIIHQIFRLLFRDSKKQTKKTLIQQEQTKIQVKKTIISANIYISQLKNL